MSASRDELLTVDHVLDEPDGALTDNGLPAATPAIEMKELSAPTLIEAVTPATFPDPFDGLPLLIAVPKAAALLGVSRAAAYRYAATGDLPTRRLGGRIYVLTTGLRRLVEDLAS